MANNNVAGLNPAQMAALLAAAAGAAPAMNVPGQQVPAAGPEQTNALAQLLQALQNQQIPAQPAPWAGLAQLFQPQPQPAPQPAPQQQPQPPKDAHEDIESEYRDARSAQLDKTLVLFMRAARSSNMTRYAILEDMNGRHGHSAKWWRTYYLIFADDIDRLVKTGVDGVDSGVSSPASRSKRPEGTGLLKPVQFACAPSSSSAAQKQKAARRSSPLPSDSESDVVEIVDHPRSTHSLAGKRKTRHPSPSLPRSTEMGHGHGSSSRPRKINRRAVDNAPEELHKDAPKTRSAYKLIIPSTLPDRAPSAPTKLVPGARGYAFTDEDIAFFVDTVLWQAKTVPGASKRTVLAALSAQASHHSWGSWDSFWPRAKGQEVLQEGLRMVAAAQEQNRD